MSVGCAAKGRRHGSAGLSAAATASAETTNAQRDFLAQHLGEHLGDVGLEPVLHPVPRERALDGKHDLGGR